MPTHPYNYRDVGETLALWLDPSPIPTRRLVRGGKFDTLTAPEDLGYARTVINLRRGPDPMHLEGVSVVHVPAMDEIENYDTRNRHVREWLARALRAIATAEPPIYVHCTSGRDRTGVVIAAALVLVGVSSEVATEEYLLSEGGQRVSIESAISGVLEVRGHFSLEVDKLRATLMAGQPTLQ